MEASVKALAGPKPERDGKFPQRYCPPAHYVVEIHSIDKLLEYDKYKFGVFEAGGYEWRLCLEPKGHTDRTGKVYMSLYLSMEEPKKLGDRSVVVDYKFFVYNNKDMTYVTLQEKGEELTAFNKANTRCGLRKFLSWDSFDSPITGFRKGNYCKFGAEVMVSKSERKEESITIVKNQPPKKIQIRNFSTSTKDAQYYSDVFKLGTTKNKEQIWRWELKVAQKGKFLSVYLRAKDLPQMVKMYVKAKLRLLNKNNPKNNKGIEVSGSLSAKNYYFSCPNFMPWEDLVKKNGGFVNEKEKRNGGPVNKKEKRNGGVVYEKELEFEVEFLVISNTVQRNELF